MDIVSCSAPLFCRDLYLFVRNFEVPKFDKEFKKGYWFADRITRYFKSDDKYDVHNISGDMTLLDVSAASGLRHETDLLIESEGNLFLFEAKCKNSVALNDLLVFNQKSLDYWIKFIGLDEDRPLFRIFVSKTKLENAFKEFAYMWSIILIEPDLLPIPAIMGTLSDNEKCLALEIYASDRHLEVLKKGCRDLGSLFTRDPSNPYTVCLDTRQMPYKGNLHLSSDSMYLLHLQLNKKILKNIINRSSDEYEDMFDQIENKIGYTREGKPK